MDRNPQTALYANLVKTGLLKHIGQGGRETTDLPKDIEDAKKELSDNQQKRLDKAVSDLIQQINTVDNEDVTLPGYTGNEPVDVVANSIVAYGMGKDIQGAQDAQRSR